MDVPTRSNRARNWRALGAVLLGLLAVAAVPAGIAVASYTDFELIDAGWSAAPAAVLGLLALWLGRRARPRPSPSASTTCWSISRREARRGAAPRACCAATTR